MLDLIIVCMVWVVIPLLFAILVMSFILKELDAEEHRKYLLEAINTSNLDKEDKAEIVCKFVNCRRE